MIFPRFEQVTGEEIVIGSSCCLFLLWLIRVNCFGFGFSSHLKTALSWLSNSSQDGLFDFSLDCEAPMGMESGRILDSALTAASSVSVSIMCSHGSHFDHIILSVLIRHTRSMHIMVEEGAMNILLVTLSQTHRAFLVTHWRQWNNKPNFIL